MAALWMWTIAKKWDMIADILSSNNKKKIHIEREREMGWAGEIRDEVNEKKKNEKVDPT